jgi:hypothetical protein
MLEELSCLGPVESWDMSVKTSVAEGMEKTITYNRLL